MWHGSHPYLDGHIKVAALLQKLHGDVLVALAPLRLLSRPVLATAPIPGPHAHRLMHCCRLHTSHLTSHQPHLTSASPHISLTSHQPHLTSASKWHRFRLKGQHLACHQTTYVLQVMYKLLYVPGGRSEHVIGGRVKAPHLAAGPTRQFSTPCHKSRGALQMRAPSSACSCTAHSSTEVAVLGGSCTSGC